MAEGDTIHRLAQRISAALAGRRVTARLPGARRPDGMRPSQLDGRTLDGVEARGKHLLLHFSDGVALHSHLGMRGSWHLYGSGERWRRPARRAWIAIAAETHEAVNFDGSSLRLVREVELPRDPRLARLGPDILDADWDVAAAASRLATAPHLQVGEALLDQTLVAGIGNIFKCEGCFAAHITPWRTVGELGADEIANLLEATRALMAAAVSSGRQPGRVYRRTGRPCSRCRTPIRSRLQGDDARTTYWCPSCQPAVTGAVEPAGDAERG